MYHAKPVRPALILPVLAWLIVLAGACAQTTEATRPQEITLTQKAPQAIFPLDVERVKAGKTIVSIQMVSVRNPGNVGFSVAVSLSGCSGNNAQHETPVGSLGVYPASETGGLYALDLGPALKQLHTMGQPAQATCLKLLLKPFRPSSDWSTLQVTLSSPLWKDPATSTK